MSGEAIGWVFRHSPLKGSDFTVHLAIADVVNDAHGHEFWMRLASLAAKARVHRDTARAALRKMEDLGLVETLEEVAGGVTRYRFVMPDGSAEMARGPAADPRPTPRQNRGVPRGNGAGIRTQSVTQPSTEVNATPSLELELAAPAAPAVRKASIVELFDRFWQAYPRRVEKRAALNAFEKAVLKTKVDPEMIIGAAARYAADPNRVDRFTKHPTTWLNGGCWEDDPLPARGSTPQRSTQRDENAAMIGRLREKFSGDGRIG